MVMDIHIHTKVGSGDSSIEPEELIEEAIRKGLDGICITEHGVKKPFWAFELGEKRGFLVIGGMEVGTELGDLLIFGVDEIPRTLYRARDLCSYVREKGGAIVAAHPFRVYFTWRSWISSKKSITLEKALGWELFRLVDAMEVVNGWATEEEVNFSFEVARRLGIGRTGGSDAHTLRDVGTCVTIFEGEIRGEEDLVREIKRGRMMAEDRRGKVRRY